MVTPAGPADFPCRLVYYFLLLFIFTEFIGLAPRFTLLQLLHINTLVPMCGFAIFLFSIGIKRKIAIIAKQGWAFIIFIILITFSFFHAYWTYIVFEHFKVILGYTIIYFLIVNYIKTFKKIRIFAFTLLLAHVILVLSNLTALSDVERQSKMDAGAFLINGNDFAFSLTLIVPLVLFLFFYEKKNASKIAILISLAVVTIGIFLTQSRGGILAYISMLAFLFITSKHKAIGVFIIVLAFIILNIAFPRAVNRMKTIKNYQEDESAQGRLDTWKASITMGLDKPLTGVGLGNFAVAYGLHYRPVNAYNQFKWLVAHSLYFQMLGELGFPGLIFIFLLLFFNAWDIALSYHLAKFNFAQGKIQKFPIYLAAILIAFIVGGAFLSCITYPHLYLYTGLIVAFKNLVKKPNQLAMKEAAI